MNKAIIERTSREINTLPSSWELFIPFYSVNDYPKNQ